VRLDGFDRLRVDGMDLLDAVAAADDLHALLDAGVERLDRLLDGAARKGGERDPEAGGNQRENDAHVVDPKRSRRRLRPLFAGGNPSG
jgi:hypothetical protein